MEKAKQLTENTPPNIKGVIVDNLIILNITGEDVHYWSPQLNFRVRQDFDEPEKTIISGLIGPRPPVWTMFMFIYFGIGTLGFFISAFAASKILMGQKSYLIAVFPLTIIFMLTAYIAGKHGEKLAKDQTEILKDFVRKVIAFDQDVENESTSVSQSE